MSNANLCKCGHIKTDHRQEKKTKQKTGACDWVECTCKKFTFAKQIQTVYPPGLEPCHELPTLIDCRNNPANWYADPENKKVNYTIADCDKHGRAVSLKHGFHKKIFNNGEYP